MILSSRDAVLGRIRSALAGDRARTDPAALAQRMASPPRWTRPAPASDRVAQFIAKAKANLSEVHDLPSIEEVPAMVAQVLRARGIEEGISVAPTLRALAWPVDLSVNFGTGRITERVAVSDALAGVAETGSLVFHSAVGRPTSLNFVPELHLAVLRRCDIFDHFEDVWPLLRRVVPWPRAVNIISAASRTADVGQVVVRPAHGPKHLDILLVGA